MERCWLFPLQENKNYWVTLLPKSLIEALQQRQVPFELGRGIISTRIPHDEIVAEVIKELGLDLAN